MMFRTFSTCRQIRWILTYVNTVLTQNVYAVKGGMNAYLYCITKISASNPLDAGDVARVYNTANLRRLYEVQWCPWCQLMHKHRRWLHETSCLSESKNLPLYSCQWLAKQCGTTQCSLLVWLSCFLCWKNKIYRHNKSCNRWTTQSTASNCVCGRLLPRDERHLRFLVHTGVVSLAPISSTIMMI